MLKTFRGCMCSGIMWLGKRNIGVYIGCGIAPISIVCWE